MKFKVFFAALASLYFCFSLAYSQQKKNKGLTKFVDPFIGTMGDGNVFLGSCLPHSFVKLGPDCEFNSGASGYKNNKEIKGFSHLHISGMGGPMYGNIQLMPTTGEIVPLNHSSGKHQENAAPGYYTVALDKYQTKAELTSTSHVGFHKYTFPKSQNAHILIDVGATLYGVSQGWSSSKPIGGEVTIDTLNNAVYGFNVYAGGRSTQKPWKVYFYAAFDTDFDSYGSWLDSLKYDDKLNISGAEIGAYLNFKTIESQQIQVKVGISMINIKQAKTSIETEIPDWDFDQIKTKANQAWEKELSKIQYSGGSENENRMFYTSLYHTLLMPSNWTGENPVFDYDNPYYEDFLCVWDIFRTVTPLLTLISSVEYADMLNTLLDVYKHDGWLADAHSSLQREFTQVGSNTDVLFADAYVKNLKGVDYSIAYQAIKKNGDDTSFLKQNIAYAGRVALPYYLKYEYIPTDVDFKTRKLTVSRTLEYVYNDFCIYQLAKGLGFNEDAKRYRDRSSWYKNLWDSDIKLMRGKEKNGSWITPYHPKRSETGINFYEGQAYTWTYTVPHDVKGLIGLFGNKQGFVDSLTFAVSNHYEAYNEPSMLQLYLFIWANRPDLTQKFLRKAVKENFSDQPNGLPGNDDSGTTSAWYLWSRMGIFPVAGQNLYLIGSPSSSKTVIQLSSGKKVEIISSNSSEENIYIQSAKLNGKKYEKAFFLHDDIINGARFEFIMGPNPSKWGIKFSPPSLSDY